MCVLILANSADTDKMQHYAVFHLVFTVLKWTRLGVFCIERVKTHQGYSLSYKDANKTGVNY